MAPLLTEEESVLDPYVLLEIPTTAETKDVQRAYRKKSLKCHPDRNPSPEAAIQFRQISLALEILLDPSKRSFVDNKLEGDRRKKAKYAELDKKRKAMVDALNSREEDAKKHKVEQVKLGQQAAEEERIKDAGRKMREDAQRRAMAQSNARPKSPTPELDAKPVITSIDLTITMQFPSSSTIAQSSSQALQAVLSAKYGPIAHIILSEPASAAEGKKKKAKGKKAVVEFSSGNWGGCWACWKDHESGAGGIEEGVKAKWAIGKMPDWVDWASRESKLPESKSKKTPDSFTSAPDFSTTTAPDFLEQHYRNKSQLEEGKRRTDEFESMTLLKMRQMERERLEAQIRAEEDDE